MLEFRNLILLATVATGLLVAGSNASAQGTKKMNRGQMQRAMTSWPKASREAAMFMMNKYGAPAAMTADMIVWGRTGPWKRTIIYKTEYQHNFPGPHTDVMQQWIDYRVPVEMYTAMAQYDGSVVLERTTGEMSARCDKEGANFLAINLANEIVLRKRTVADARMKYGEQIMMVKSNKPAPYFEKLLFTPPMDGTGDTDHPN